MNNLTANQLLNSFYNILGIPIELYDQNIHLVAKCSNSPQDSFCSVIHQNQAATNACFQSDIRAFRIAKETKEIYSYTCPFGFFSIIIPILNDNTVIGYLFSGGAIKKAPNATALPCEKAASFFSDPTILQKLQSILKGTPSLTPEQSFSYTNIMVVLAAHIGANNLLPISEETIGTATKNYIKNNLHTKITLGEISLKLHCSKVTLTENFRKEFGVTIVQYINEKRMEAARIMLQNSDASITTIAEECGFSGMEYFSIFFKKKYGMSPSAWRKKYRQKN